MWRAIHKHKKISVMSISSSVTGKTTKFAAHFRKLTRRSKLLQSSFLLQKLQPLTSIGICWKLLIQSYSFLLPEFQYSPFFHKMSLVNEEIVICKIMKILALRNFRCSYLWSEILERDVPLIFSVWVPFPKMVHLMIFCSTRYRILWIGNNKGVAKWYLNTEWVFHNFHNFEFY